MKKINLGRIAGTMIYTGSAMSGIPDVYVTFPNSGIKANEGDLYINISENSDSKGNIYKCVMPGDAEDAEWGYVGNLCGTGAKLVNSLESESTTEGLTAYQGKRLYEFIKESGILNKHCIVECDEKTYAVKLYIDNVATKLTFTVDGKVYDYNYKPVGNDQQRELSIYLDMGIGMHEEGGILTNIKSSDAYIYKYQILASDLTVLQEVKVDLWESLNNALERQEITGSITEAAGTFFVGNLYKIVNKVKKAFYPITHAKAVWYDQIKNITVYDKVRENADAVESKPPKNHASSHTTYGVGSNGYYGHVKLSDSVGLESDTTDGTAATPKAVKKAYDIAKEALPAKGGNVSGALAFTAEATQSGMLYLTNVDELMELLRAITGEDPTVIVNNGMYTAGIGSLNLGAGKNVRLLIKNERLVFEESSENAYSAHFRPQNDNKCTLGTAAKRFYGLWAGNSAIQTSDAREKENIIPLGSSNVMTLSLDETQLDIHSELFDRLRPVQFNFVNGNGRICYGLVAQEVAETLAELGIDEDELDLVHHEFYRNEKTKKEMETYGLAYNNLIALLIHEVQKLKAEVSNLKK